MSDKVHYLVARSENATVVAAIIGRENPTINRWILRTDASGVSALGEHCEQTIAPFGTMMRQ